MERERIGGEEEEKKEIRMLPGPGSALKRAVC
jgi:hypothetical protein